MLACQRIMRRRRYLIAGLALLVVVSPFANFVLSFVFCGMGGIWFSPPGNIVSVMDTETFVLVEYKHHTWTNVAMVTLIIGKETSRFFPESMTGQLSQLKPRVFDYIINNRSLCKTSGELSFVLSVLTSPNHFEDRVMLRSTYGRQNLFSRYPSRTVFFLGAVSDRRLQASIVAESQKYGDIVQADFIDSYHNLSYKSLTQLQWFNEFCGNAKHLIKVDDDLYFDIFQIVKVVQRIASVPRFVIGDLWSGANIFRTFSKYKIRSEILPMERCFPPFFHGWLYIIPTTLFSDLYKAAMRTPVVQLEDVYLTGLVMGQLPDIKYIHFSGKAPDGYFMPAHPKLAQECDASCKLPLWCKHLSNLCEEDKELIGAEKVDVILRNLDCKNFQLP